MCSSCKNIVTHHLDEGLVELENSKQVKKELIEGYLIHSVGFFKNDNGTQKIAIRLNEEITEELISKYTLGIHIKPYGSDSVYLPKGKNYISFDFVPKLSNFDDYKYIIKDFETSIKQIKSIRFFLYNLGKYEKRYGNNVTIKNVRLY